MKMGPHAFPTGRLGTAFRAHSKPLTTSILGFVIENYHMKKKIHFPSFHFHLHGHRKGGGGGGGQNSGQFREQDTTKGTQHKKEH